MVCTFFGHRDCPSLVKNDLCKTIGDLIRNHGVDRFLVGNEGAFDRMVFASLCEMAKDYPHIRYEMVLAYLPTGSNRLPKELSELTIFPDGIEIAPKKFAIVYRNRWMLDRADYVIAYVDHTWGGAWQWFEKAKRMGKTVINLYK